MNKKQKYIICFVISILIILLFILITIIIKISKDTNKCFDTRTNSNEMISVVGIYNNNNWNGNEATLILNQDMTCKYPNSGDECKWTIVDKNITIILTYYMIMNEGKDQIPTITKYNTKSKCEEDLRKYESVYNLVNPTCEITKYKHEAILGDDGLILHEHLFNKVG